MNKLPTIAELRGDMEFHDKNEALHFILNQNPDPSWIKKHKYIKGWQYLPIDRIEWLLKKIFKEYRIEILEQGAVFNAVWVKVRLHYMHPISGQWSFHDGIGSQQVQTAKGANPTDMTAINNGAVTMAFPIAEVTAIKNAAKKFGRLFGSALNREDNVHYDMDSHVENPDVYAQEMNAKMQPQGAVMQDAPHWAGASPQVNEGAF